jgi:hypothetical protein
MSIHNIFSQKNSVLTTVVNGDFDYEGNFADAVTDYLADVATCTKYQKDKDFPDRATLTGAAEWYPLAQMEQVIVALWSTVPKHVFNKRYANMLREVGLVVNYFSTGDLALYESAIEEIVEGFDTDPVDILTTWLTLLQDVMMSSEEAEFYADDKEFFEGDEEEIDLETVPANAVRELWTEV